MSSVACAVQYMHWSTYISGLCLLVTILQMEITVRSQVLDVQHSYCNGALAPFGPCFLLKKPQEISKPEHWRKKVKWKEQFLSVFCLLIGLNLQHSYFGSLISGFMLPLFTRNYLNTDVSLAFLGWTNSAFLSSVFVDFSKMVLCISLDFCSLG